MKISCKYAEAVNNEHKIPERNEKNFEGIVNCLDIPNQTLISFFSS